MKKIFSAVFLGCTAMVSAFAGEQYVGISKTKYKESDQRMDIDYVSLSVLKDLGTDFTVSFNATEDAMTGATPVWDHASGASKYTAIERNGMIGPGLTRVKDYNFENHEMEDKRVAYDLSVTWRTPEARDELTVGISHSEEEDYRSKGISAQYLHYLDPSKNRSVTAGLSVLDNDVEFRRTQEWKKAKFYNAQIGLTQIFSPNMAGTFSLFTMYDSGALTNPYQTVLRAVNTGTDKRHNFRYFLSPEKRPDRRRIYGINVEGSRRLQQKISGAPVTLYAGYRLYQDDWDITGHTLKGKIHIGDIDRYGRLSFGMRYVHQSEASFYKAYNSKDNFFDLKGYASSDERLGELTTTTVELGYEIRLMEHWHFTGHVARQHQSTGLKFNWITMGVRYDF